MLRRIALLIFALVLAYPAWGGEGAKNEKKPEPGTSVEMPFLIAPMAQDGNLLGYSYISSKLTCSSPSACIAVREKLAFIQDAYVRDVNLRPVALATDPKQVDKDALAARLTTAAKHIVGDSKVVGMSFIEIKFAPLHPSESTEGAIPPDKAAAEGAQQTGNAPGSAPAGGNKTAAPAGATSKPATGKTP
jgi:hypothetical protein